MYHARCSRTFSLDMSPLRCDTSLRYLPTILVMLYTALLQCYEHKLFSLYLLSLSLPHSRGGVPDRRMKARSLT